MRDWLPKIHPLFFCSLAISIPLIGIATFAHLPSLSHFAVAWSWLILLGLACVHHQAIWRSHPSLSIVGPIAAVSFLAATWLAWDHAGMPANATLSRTAFLWQTQGLWLGLSASTLPAMLSIWQQDQTPPSQSLVKRFMFIGLVGVLASTSVTTPMIAMTAAVLLLSIGCPIWRLPLKKPVFIQVIWFSAQCAMAGIVLATVFTATPHRLPPPALHWWLHSDDPGSRSQGHCQSCRPT